MKSKILLIGDDIRYPTGVSNICKNIILNTIDKYDWIQIACRKEHPEHGSVIDISQSITKLTDVKDCYARLYCSSGYGNETILNKILEEETPDVVMFMTDPRYYQWLFKLDTQIRQLCPMIYYHVWDNDPIPEFNKKVYMSCDGIACISQLTYSIVNSLTEGSDTLCNYVPHGVDTTVFNKLSESNIRESKYNLLKNGCEFALFCNNANMRRKQLPVVMEAYDKFCSMISPEQAEKTLLMFHTNQIGEGGHDIVKLSDQLYPNRNIIFSTTKVDEITLNRMYNTFDVTINASSNEGFGLSTAESLAAGTPIICNKTGGLSDQLSKTNTGGVGITPKVRKLSGDATTPYLYEDFVCSDDVARAIIKLYNKTPKQRLEMGKSGRKYIEKNFSLKHMTSGIIDIIDTCIKKFKPRTKLKIKKL